MSRFFEDLSFSSSNEDGATELALFNSPAPRRLLCLTGSGSRVLDMVLAQPGELIALDLNPSQNELLRLKIAAFQTLPDADLTDYLGLTPSTSRLSLHAKVERALSAPSRAFWEKRRSLIATGVWYCGLWERVLRVGSRATRLIRGKSVERLFSAPTLSEQSEIWQKEFDDRLWRGAIRLLARRWFWTHVIGEPGGQFLPAPAVVEARLAGAFARAAQTFFLRDSDFSSLVIRGEHRLPYAVPLHLQERHRNQVRQGLDRIRIVDGGLHDLPKLDIKDVDAFSLSDFGSYCDQAAYEACWRGIRTVASKGARVCEREFLNALPLAPGINWNGVLSDSLTALDKSFIYKIRAGTID